MTIHTGHLWKKINGFEIRCKCFSRATVKGRKGSYSDTAKKARDKLFKEIDSLNLRNIELDIET